MGPRRAPKPAGATTKPRPNEEPPRMEELELPRLRPPRLVQTKLEPVAFGRNNRTASRTKRNSVEEIEAPPKPTEQPPKKPKLGKNPKEMLQELIDFDLDSSYGPACGVSRSERLERALEWGLGAKEELERLRGNLEALLAMEKEKGKLEAEQCLWDHRTFYANY